MSIAEQLEGQRIAKEVVAQDQARELLGSRSKTRWWGIFLIIAIGGVIGAANSAIENHLLVGILAGIGAYTGTLAYIETLNLRRRLDALQVLLLTDE